MNESQGHAVELAIFKVKPGVGRERLLETVGPVSDWVRTQPGFISRDLTYSADTDTWIDVIWWASLDDARAAAEAAMSSESCGAMFALIDLEGTQMIHGERVAPSVGSDVEAA